MNRSKSETKLKLLAIIMAALIFALGCASTASTATPIPPAKPAPPSAPTALPVTNPLPTFSMVPIATVAIPTPTRVLPTPTPMVTGKPQYGGALRFAHLLAIDSLDPLYSTFGGTYQELYAVYDQLFRIDEAGNVLPSLAQSWDFSTDGKDITLRLQKGVKFHDGTTFAAEVVKWNFDRMLDSKQNSPRTADLKPYLQKVEALGEDSLKMQLYNPFRPLLPQLGSEPMGFLVSPSAVSKYGGGREGNYGRNPVGTGPFRFIEWVPDDHVLLRRNESYWETGNPYLDSILVLGIKDPSVRIAMLRTGEADVIYSGDVQGQDVPIIERNQQLKVVRLPGSGTYFLHFNPAVPPFDNKSLRQSIAFSMDRSAFIKVVLGGVGTPAYTLTAAGWAYNPDLKPIEFNIVKAKQKLTEAGYPKGIVVPMGCPSSGVYLQMCEFAQAMAKEAGINIEIKLLNPTTYFDSVTDAGFYVRWGFGATQWFFRVDPHTLIQNLAYSAGKFQRMGGYKNPEIDALIEQAATTYDTAKAKLLYDKIQSTTTEDVLGAFLARSEGLYPMNKRVQGFVPYPTRFEHLEFVWFEK